MTFSRGLSAFFLSIEQERPNQRNFYGQEWVSTPSRGALSSNPGTDALWGCSALRDPAATWQSWLQPSAAVYTLCCSDEWKPDTSKLVSFSLGTAPRCLVR